MLTVPVPDGAAAGAKYQRAVIRTTIASAAVATAAIKNGRGMCRFFELSRAEVDGAAGAAVHSDASS